MAAVWSLLTLARRQYAGNEGYDDGDDRYSFDSFVANSRRLREGDQAVLRDEDGAFAIANIEAVSEREGQKLQRRCPECRLTGIKERSGLSPRFRCSNGHVFDAPLEDEVRCRIFQARFGDSRRPLSRRIPSVVIRRAVLRYNEQHAIQELNRSALTGPELEPLSGALQTLRRKPNYPEPEDSKEPQGGYTPSGFDTRVAAIKSVRDRRGQPMFRRVLRRRYGDRCQVSGCALLDLLEAAHISPYRGEDDQHPENGLLLRADLHTLFDLDLMGIDPETLTVHFHASVLADPSYGQFAGRSVACGTRRPSRQALESRWAAFRNRTSR